MSKGFLKQNQILFSIHALYSKTAGAKSSNMKISQLLVLFCLITVGVVRGQSSGFTSLDSAMDPDTYRKAGLQKLTDQEREVLNSFLRKYIASGQQAAAEKAASVAVDRAVKERRVSTPTVIESRIVGTFAGYNDRSRFHLANGQIWQPTDYQTVKLQPEQNPQVVIFRDLFGYKMYIEGACIVRVKRVQ